MNVYYIHVTRDGPKVETLSVDKIPNDPHGLYRTLEANHGYPAGYILALGSWCLSKEQAISKCLKTHIKDLNEYMTLMSSKYKTIQSIKSQLMNQ